LQAAIAAALVNIKIPLLLGDVVNVVSNLNKEATSDFISNLKVPAIKLMMVYGVQVWRLWSIMSLLGFFSKIR
jgi:ATP-binding cassette subfamily B (MDR/TAP) protein 8